MDSEYSLLRIKKTCGWCSGGIIFILLNIILICVLVFKSIFIELYCPSYYLVIDFYYDELAINHDSIFVFLKIK